MCRRKKILTFFDYKSGIQKTIKVNKEPQTVFEIKKVPLHKCAANTGVIGLLVCLNSMEYLCNTRIVETKSMSYLTMFKFSQDHIELFFGKIRSLGGFNNNPNARQFKSAYKKSCLIWN